MDLPLLNPQDRNNQQGNHSRLTCRNSDINSLLGIKGKLFMQQEGYRCLVNKEYRLKLLLERKILLEMQAALGFLSHQCNNNLLCNLL
jgi:hypothetical protein